MTLSGDGDYRLTDFYFAFDQFSKKNLGGIFGTRVQSRVQFQKTHYLLLIQKINLF